MNGCVIKGTPIAVDFWKLQKAPQARLFFLTHLHADHIQGLSSSWRLPIYTSPINSKLLLHKFKQLPRSIVRELNIGETYTIPLDDEGDHCVSITVFDANHVPGAVMFLFQGYFGNILYCGDMRWYPQLLEHPVLRDVVEQRALDVLYLDNTFSAPHCLFPSRQEAKEQLFQIIQAYPDHVIKLGIRELGREDLLEAVAKRFEEKIAVDHKKYKLLQLLGCSNVFTSNPQEARIHAVDMRQLQVATLKKWNLEHPTKGILLTALYVGWQNGPYSRQSGNGILVVPYSDHSSYSELMDMVAQLAPRQVEPIVRQWSKSGWWSEPSAPDQTVKGDMSVYSHLLSVPPPEPYEVPEAIVKLMSSGSPLLLSDPQRSSRKRAKLRHNPPPRPRCTKGVVFTSEEDHVSSPYRADPLPEAASNSVQNVITVESESSSASLPLAASTSSQNGNNTGETFEEMSSSNEEAYSLGEQAESDEPSVLNERHRRRNDVWLNNMVHLVKAMMLLQRDRLESLDNMETYSEEYWSEIIEKQITIRDLLEDIYNSC